LTPRGLIPSFSIYGPRRIFISCKELLHANVDFYFADFYCTSWATDVERIHSLLIVAVEEGDPQAKFISKHLLKLDMQDNPFFRLAGKETYLVCTRYHLWIEILWVGRAVSITGRDRTTVNHDPEEAATKSVAHNRTCSLCNLLA